MLSVSAPGGSAAESKMVKLLGPQLKTASGLVATGDAINGKTLGIYFSAHWCPPCRSFTPKLAQAYKSLKQAGKDFEIVFVSSDRDEAAFNGYFGEMPWLALPFGERKIKSALSEKFGVAGIPMLVLLDAEGNLITTNGRAKIMEQPDGRWIPKPKPAKLDAPKPVKPAAAAMAAAHCEAVDKGGLAALLGSAPLLTSDGKTKVELSQVVKDAPLVALYFSAHWCGPCRAFTPKLVTFVEMLKEEGVELPIIFGSSDRDEASFQSYFATMPWAAFPLGDSRIEALKKKFGVSGIPWLVVLDAKGNLVLNEADTDVPQGPQAYAKWLEMAKTTVAAAPAA